MAKKYETGDKGYVFDMMAQWAIENIDAMIDGLTPPSYVETPEWNREQLEKYKALKRDFVKLAKTTPP